MYVRRSQIVDLCVSGAETGNRVHHTFSSIRVLNHEYVSPSAHSLPSTSFLRTSTETTPRSFQADNMFHVSIITILTDIPIILGILFMVIQTYRRKTAEVVAKIDETVIMNRE